MLLLQTCKGNAIVNYAISFPQRDFVVLESQQILRLCSCAQTSRSLYTSCAQGGYIFYAGASLARVSCRRRWPRLLLLS